MEGIINLNNSLSQNLIETRYLIIKKRKRKKKQAYSSTLDKNVSHSHTASQGEASHVSRGVG